MPRNCWGVVSFSFLSAFVTLGLGMLIQLLTPPSPATTTTTTSDGEPHLALGRLAVLPAFRGRGFARLLISAAVQFAQENPTLFNVSQPGRDLAWKGLVCCHAQVGAMEMWARNGFQVDESLGRWWEEGMEHVGMYKRCEVAGQ